MTSGRLSGTWRLPAASGTRRWSTSARCESLARRCHTWSATAPGRCDLLGPPA
jgi:hypothetical protein